MFFLISIFGAGSFLEAFSSLIHKKIDQDSLPWFLCILLFYELLMYSIVFSVFVLWFALFEIFIWINMKMN